MAIEIMMMISPREAAVCYWAPERAVGKWKLQHYMIALCTASWLDYRLFYIRVHCCQLICHICAYSSIFLHASYLFSYKILICKNLQRTSLSQECEADEGIHGPWWSFFRHEYVPKFEELGLKRLAVADKSKRKLSFQSQKTNFLIIEKILIIAHDTYMDEMQWFPKDEE